MRDYGVSVLEQYEIDVKETRRVRGGVLVETLDGVYLLKETTIHSERLDFLVNLYDTLNENGFALIDTPKANKEGNYLSEAEDGTTYLLKRWFLGHECDMKKESEVIEGAKVLARLHNKLRMQKMDVEPLAETNNLLDEYERHNRELRKIYTFIQKRSVKNKFEAMVLQGYHKMYEQAQNTLDKMRSPEYLELCEHAWENREICHGDYNYHNLIFSSQGVCVTGFERAHIETQLSDFYYYLRKVLEKYHYDEKIGYRMLRAYDSVIPLGRKERDYLAIQLSYPEKFWKILNAYYHSNKAWVSEKNVEKLCLSIAQTNEKKRFIESVFGFAL